MSLHAAIVESLERSFGLYEDLVATIPEAALAERLPGLPSNTVGAQLWCVIGARESYTRGLEAGAWAGFACSLDGASAVVRSDVADALARSAAEAMRLVAGVDDWTDARCRLLLDLVEHEAAHQGQLVRYLYGLRLPIPESWRERYALE